MMQSLIFSFLLITPSYKHHTMDKIQSEEKALVLSYELIEEKIEEKSEGGQILRANIIERKNNNIHKKNWFFISGQHGDELVATDSLLSFYQKVKNDNLISSDFWKENRIVFILLANPDNFAKSRKNLASIDTNRDFPNSVMQTLRSQTRTSQFIQSVMSKYNPYFTLDVHAGIDFVALYPFAFSFDQKPSEIQKNSNKFLKKQNIIKVKASHLDQLTFGELLDFVALEYQTTAYTIELGEDKTVDDDRKVERSIDMLENFIMTFINQECYNIISLAQAI